MKIKILGLLLLISFQLSAQNELKETVVVVRPVYSSETITFFKDISSALMKNGFVGSARIMRRNAQGVFGSGFIYKDDKDAVYVITNKHVVHQAKNVNIEIIKAIGDTVKYENCRVVAVAQNADLALVALPENVKIAKSLHLAKTAPVEGSDVWSAGFPGLDGKPSWQLGKGIISNRSLQNKEVFDNDSLSLIQHTAQVDAGSSGGPLLRATDNNNYEVIGVNTWKLGGRENANVALPVEAIENFIQTAINPETFVPSDALNEQTAGFVAAAAKNDYREVRKYVSYQYVYHVTPKSFDAMLTKISKDAKDAIFAQFRSGEPIEGIRSLIADALVQKVQKYAGSLHFSQADLADTTTVLSFDFNGKRYESQWENEQGQWGLSDFPILQVDRVVAKNGIAYDFDYDRSWWFRRHIQVGDYTEKSYEIGHDMILATYGFLSTEILWGKYFRPIELSSGNETQSEIISDPFFSIEFGLGGQLPFRIASCYLIPYANVITGMRIGEDSGGFFTGFRSGVKLGFKLSSNIIYIGGDFKYHIPIDFEASGKFKTPITSIGISLGYIY
ncbi:MAG: serine protease [Dysgonamonadaceae bacterium]|jgi:serine protease Do|nr:serine protease [Dysgonamonadaceae bacterium]